MFTTNEINIVRKWLENRFNTLNVVYIRSGASGILWEVNDKEFTTIIDSDYEVTLAYTQYGVPYTVKGGYSLYTLTSKLLEEVHA